MKTRLHCHCLNTVKQLVVGISFSAEQEWKCAQTNCYIIIIHILLGLLPSLLCAKRDGVIPTIETMRWPENESHASIGGERFPSLLRTKSRLWETFQSMRCHCKLSIQTKVCARDRSGTTRYQVGLNLGVDCISLARLRQQEMHSTHTGMTYLTCNGLPGF